MKFRTEFLVIIGIVTMSFTILSHTNVIKKSTMTNCYFDPSLLYLGINPPACNFIAVNCSIIPAAKMKYVESNFTSGGFMESISCEGSDRICCVSFIDGGTINPPCQFSSVLKSTTTAPVRDMNAGVMPNGHYVKINEIQCHDE